MRCICGYVTVVACIASIVMLGFSDHIIKINGPIYAAQVQCRYIYDTRQYECNICKKYHGNCTEVCDYLHICESIDVEVARADENETYAGLLFLGGLLTWSISLTVCALVYCTGPQQPSAVPSYELVGAPVEPETMAAA
jgi:hypothetical protein